MTNYLFITQFITYKIRIQFPNSLIVISCFVLFLTSALFGSRIFVVIGLGFAWRLFLHLGRFTLVFRRNI